MRKAVDLMTLNLLERIFRMERGLKLLLNLEQKKNGKLYNCFAGGREIPLAQMKAERSLIYSPNCCHSNKSPPKAFPGAIDKRSREFVWVLQTVLSGKI